MVRVVNTKNQHILIQASLVVRASGRKMVSDSKEVVDTIFKLVTLTSVKPQMY